MIYYKNEKLYKHNNNCKLFIITKRDNKFKKMCPKVRQVMKKKTNYINKII